MTRLVPPPEPARPSRLPRTQVFADRLAVVTGAAVGIGAGIARALAYHGARVLLVDRDAPDAVAATIRADGGPAPEPLVGDVTDPATVERIRTRATALGGADVLVNNVGDYRPAGPFVTGDPAGWRRMAAVNFDHVLACTHALLPGMVDRQDGAIVNVSSVEGLRGIPGNAVYGAYKAAVVAFTASLAAEVGQYGIRVNCIAPDLTDTVQTPMWQAVDERYADHVGKWVPVGRFGAPVDCGDAVVFLAGPQSAFVSGATLRVDGGTLAAPGWFRRDETRFTNLPRPLR